MDRASITERVSVWLVEKRAQVLGGAVVAVLLLLAVAAPISPSVPPDEGVPPRSSAVGDERVPPETSDPPGESVPRHRSAPAEKPQGPPNVVVIMSDDQTIESMRVMPKTLARFDDEGVEFTESVVSNSLCCPSRATFLTGQLSHNHGVMSNAPPSGGFAKLDAANTLAVWLQDAGYHTTLIGKYLNGYDDADAGVPPGWDDWRVSKSDFRYYGADVLVNDTLITYGDPAENPDDPADPDSYIDDVYTAHALDVIKDRAPSRDPFFLWLSYTAPHMSAPETDADQSSCAGSPKPAPRHLGEFASARLPRPPSFNETDMSDKSPLDAGRSPLSAGDIEKISRRWRCTLAAVQSIDDGVERVFDALEASGELDNTLVIYTSDNGFMHGEHRIRVGKSQGYEEAIRVPLFMRGPEIPAGTRIGELVANTDLAPTIADLAGILPPLLMDGESLLPIVERPNLRRGRAVLLENKRVLGVRTYRFAYMIARNGIDRGFEELYDLERDPYEVDNVAASPEYRHQLTALRGLFATLVACRGSACQPRPRAWITVRDTGGTLAAKGCASGALRVSLDGPDSRGLGGASAVFAGEPVAIRNLRPLHARVELDQPAHAEQQVVAQLDLSDGRRLTLHRHVRIC